MIKVNLVPRELLDREVQKQRILQGAVLAGVAAIGVLCISASHWYQATKFEAQLAELNKEHDKLAKIVAQVEELERTAQAVKTRLTVITGLLKGRALYPFFMIDLMASMPPGVWLTSLNTSAKEPNGLTVTIANASANSSDGVSQWLRNFEKSTLFVEAKLSGAVNVQEVGDVKEYKFSIVTEYKNPKLN